MSFWRPGFVAVAAVSAFLTVRTSTQEQPLYRSGVRTVPVYATVIDARGRLVPELNQADFSIMDNGKPAALSIFSSESQPFTAVVMLDTSASMTANLTILNQAAEQFLIRLLPDDRAQVGAFNDKIQLSGTFTSDRDALVSALSELQFGNPTRLHDAIAASLDALRGVDGRRVILVFTDGDDTASRLGFKTVLERARDEEVMVYAIGLESNYFNGARVVKNRRWILRARENRRSGANLFAGRARIAKPVPAWVRTDCAGRQIAQTRHPRVTTRHDSSGAQNLSRGSSNNLYAAACFTPISRLA